MKSLLKEYIKELLTQNLNEVNWKTSKKAARKLAKTIRKKYGPGFKGKVAWAKKWADHPEAVAASLSKEID